MDTATFKKVRDINWRNRTRVPPTMREGAVGAHVRALQGRLGMLDADGMFGLVTRRAVMKFQADHGLKADGVVDSLTWVALSK